jgi:hypothetical protein
MTNGKTWKTFWLASRLAAVAMISILASAPTAPAEDGGFAGFLSHLFGAPATKPVESAPPAAAAAATPRKPRKKMRDFVPATTTRAPGAPGGSPVQASFFVDVIGDSLAVSTAEGLVDAFADRPEMAIVNRAREASGLVRDDYFDWPKTASDLAAGKAKIDFVVVMFGVNDIQTMRDGADSVEPLTDRWRERYGERVESIVAPFRAAHIPVAWVGLPPMRADHFNSEAVTLNDIYKEHAESAGGKYIDIWDAFADQNGQYDAFGPNIDGQNAKLRGVDGIHFTKAGSRKVAHFLEGEIRKALDKTKPTNDVASLPPDIEQAADDINAQIRREMGAPPAEPNDASTTSLAVAKPLVGPIVSLTARPSTPGGALMTRDPRPLEELPEVLRVIRRGEPVAIRGGRADDFAWPRL